MEKEVKIDRIAVIYGQPLTWSPQGFPPDNFCRSQPSSTEDMIPAGIFPLASNTGNGFKNFLTLFYFQKYFTYNYCIVSHSVCVSMPQIIFEFKWVIRAVKYR